MEHCCFQPSFNKWSFDIYHQTCNQEIHHVLLRLHSHTPPSTTTKPSTWFSPLLCEVMTPLASSSSSCWKLWYALNWLQSIRERETATPADTKVCKISQEVIDKCRRADLLQRKWKGLELYLKRGTHGGQCWWTLQLMVDGFQHQSQSYKIDSSIPDWSVQHFC